MTIVSLRAHKTPPHLANCQNLPPILGLTFNALGYEKCNVTYVRPIVDVVCVLRLYQVKKVSHCWQIRGCPIRIFIVFLLFSRSISVVFNSRMSKDVGRKQ